MLKTALLFVALGILLFKSRVLAASECCSDDNVLSHSNHSCSNGHPLLNNLNCSISFIMSLSELQDISYRFLDNGTLLDEEGREKGYCYSKVDEDWPNDRKTDQLIYVVCYTELPEESFNEVVFVVKAILGCISAFFLIVTVAIYLTIPSLLDLQGICMMHALTGMIVGLISLAVLQLDSNMDSSACESLPYLVYAAFMYLFFWLATLSFHIWRITVKPQYGSETVKWSVFYHVFAIGGTLFMVFIVVLAHHSPSAFWDDARPGFGDLKCWFTTNRLTWLYFYCPILILLVFNVIFYLWTIVSLWKQTETSRHKVLKYRLKLCIRLCVIMGITWILEIISFFIDNATYAMRILQFVLDLFTILQGIAIFLVLVVFRKRVRRALANKRCCNVQLPGSWKYLEDDEMESLEVRANGVAVEYRKQPDVVDINS